MSLPPRKLYIYTTHVIWYIVYVVYLPPRRRCASIRQNIIFLLSIFNVTGATSSFTSQQSKNKNEHAPNGPISADTERLDITQTHTLIHSANKLLECACHLTYHFSAVVGCLARCLHCAQSPYSNVHTDVVVHRLSCDDCDCVSVSASVCGSVWERVKYVEFVATVVIVASHRIQSVSKCRNL